MPTFSKRSRDRLSTCHHDIILILNESIRIVDFSVLEGIRTTARQQELYNSFPKKTKLDGILLKSKHQARKEDKYPVSYAVDVVPYKKGLDPFDGKPKTIARFYFLVGVLKAVAFRLLSEGKISHSVRFGADWDGDMDFADQSFDDLPHMELMEV